MKNVHVHKSHWVFTVLVAGSAVLYAVAVFLPVQRSIASVHSDAHQHAKYIKNVDQQYLAYPRVEESLLDAEAYLREWREKAPPSRQFSAFLGEITRTAADSNASVQRFTPQAANHWKAIRAHPLEAIVEGTFAEIHAFVQGVEKLSPAIWVEDLEIQAIDRNEGNLRCELTLKVFSENLDSSD